MRLLKRDNQNNYSLTDDLIDNLPPYAILSHTWGPDHDEVTFTDLQQQQDRSKAGYAKLKFCIEQAKRDHIEHVWVDTCCIRKDSQTELSEAITSMFRWYQDAEKCYVYLADLSAPPSDDDSVIQSSLESSFRNSRWFTRGWTLQELLAPTQVEFFSWEGTLLGTRTTLARQIQEVTRIPLRALSGTPLSQFSIAERMRWQQNRKTKKEEDRAYCLLGIFGVSMYLQYGEKEHAFERLRKEIIEKYNHDFTVSLNDVTEFGRYGPHRKRAICVDLDESAEPALHVNQLAHDPQADRSKPAKRVRASHDANVPRTTKAISCGDTAITTLHVKSMEHHAQGPSQDSPYGPISYDENKYKVLLESLLFDRIEFRVNNVKKALMSTCQWLLRHPHFKSWFEYTSSEQHSGFLWIKGKPGCGKSTLMKTALGWAQKQRRQGHSKRVIIPYSFHARALASLEKSSSGLYRTAVYRLVSSYPGLRPLFTERFALKSPGDSGDNWTVEELQDFLYDVAESNESLRLCLFIDALDEAEHEDDVRQMISFLIQFSDRASTTSGFHRVQVCLSSRHYPHITIGRGLSMVVEDQPEHDSDIDTYITKELTCSQGSDNDKLRAKILDKSAHIFLWVVLVVRILNKLNDCGATMPDMIARLTSIPADLNELFRQILIRSDHGTESSILLFQWMLFRMRPLEPAELFLAIQYSKSPSDARWPAAAEIPVPTFDRLTRSILDYSRGLVEVAEVGPSQAPVVQFIHEAVREFLVSKNGLTSILPDLATNIAGISHETLGVACFRRVSAATSVPTEYEHYCRDSHKSNGLHRKFKVEMRSRFPFLDYALLHLFDHGEQAQRHDIAQQVLLTTCIDVEPFWTRYLLWWNILERYQSRKLQSDMILLEFVVERQQPRLLSMLLNLPKFAAVTERERSSLLLRAIHHFSVKVLQLLLDHGVDPNAVNKTLPGLYIAAGRGHDEAVQTLINAGADVNAQGGTYDSALQAASADGHDKVVQLLINAGANVNAQGGLYGSALQAAARGRDKVVQLLIDGGADVNAQGGHWGNALQAASAGGHDKVVQLLIDGGADVNAQGGRWGNALQAAFESGRNKVVQILATAGAHTREGISDDAV